MSIEDRLEKSARLLIENGYVNDENGRLGSNYFEYQTEAFDCEMRLRGYDGPELKCYGKFYQGHGAVYWVYDPRRLSYQESVRMTDKWVNVSNS